MVLHIIGVGLLEPSDISVKGIKAITSCSTVYFYLSNYQPYLKTALEEFLNRSFLIFGISEISNKIKELAYKGRDSDIAILMPGDPFCDQLYSKLKLECNISSTVIKVIHNASVLNYVSNCGLQLYRFGRIVYGNNISHTNKLLEIVKENIFSDLHTLILLDQNTSSFMSFTEMLVANQTVLCQSEGIVFVSLKNSNLQILGPYNFYSDFSVLQPLSIIAMIVTARFHEMEKDVFDYLSSSKQKSVTSNGIFHLIGLGLGAPEDITMKGKAAICSANKVYLEGYTSVMIGGKECLEDYFGKEITVAHREMVESDAQEILSCLHVGSVAFLVVGDPLGATTHTDLMLRAANIASSIDVIHNASIINAAGISGLNPEKFGTIVSIPFWDTFFNPDSFYDKICQNLDRNLHTLCLLDIKVREQSVENLMKGKNIFEKPRYMTVAQAADQLLMIYERRIGAATSSDVALPMTLSPHSEIVCLARIGSENECVRLLTLSDARNLDFGGPLHSLIVVGQKDSEEDSVLNLFRN